ncbi:MAG: thioredoxin domain-containing protein, partial [Gammaproteobacteria bacterium]|nr:thioredoxin domain-containing protein [Gammaproteobacteria bacterium]
HVILTPEGYPFAAFIYLPNKDFNQTLQTVVKYWQQTPDKIRKIAQDSVTPTVPAQAFNLQPIEFKGKLLEQVSRSLDDLSGGLTGSTKFPQAPLLKGLLSIPELTPAIEQWLLLTLDQMQDQHLFDHIHGGFYRYTVDPEWQIPHFEKMAYTQALLADIYLQAGQRYHRQDYLDTAKSTLEYLKIHLFNAKVGLYQSSQSAIDKHGEEGGYYLWHRDRLQKTLSKAAFAEVNQAWSLGAPMPHDLGWHPSKTEFHWPAIKAALTTPVERIPVDTKSILGWNGLILSALSRAYSVLNDSHYLERANQLAKRLNTLLQNSHPPRALSDNGDFMGEANLQDYAFIYQGLKDWQQLSLQPPDKTALTDSISTLEMTILDKFYTSSGWRYHPTPLLPGQQGEWVIEDNAIPSPTAIVSCLAPKSMLYAGQDLMRLPINYPSYLSPINHCVKP